MIVAIGASTGGPTAVKKVLSQLPKDFPWPIVIVQHVEMRHASGMSDWLGNGLSIPVRTACEGDRLLPGRVLFSATNDHLVLRPPGRLAYTKNPMDEPYRPSVDAFFASLGLYSKEEVIAVLLTGMGRDGARGLLALRRLGHTTFAQDQKSSAVYGMPKAAADLGAAMEILNPTKMGQRLKELAVRHQNWVAVGQARRWDKGK